MPNDILRVYLLQKEDKESRKATLKAEYESKLTAYSGSSDEDDETSKFIAFTHYICN